MTSSWVGPKQNSRSWRSWMRSSSLPYCLPAAATPARARPAGPPASSSSTAPARFISSRTIASSLREARQPERQVGVDAGGDLRDHAGAHQELVRDHLGVGGDLARRVQVELAPAHAHRFGFLCTRSSRRAESCMHSIIRSSSAPTRGSQAARPAERGARLLLLAGGEQRHAEVGERGRRGPELVRALEAVDRVRRTPCACSAPSRAPRAETA